MKINEKFLQEFEEGLDPLNPERSKIPAKIIGYGEISSIFRIEGYSKWIYKRMPLFETKEQAVAYDKNYKQYVEYLKSAGLNLPKDFSKITKSRKYVLYLGQEEFIKSNLCHNRLHTQSKQENIDMLNNIFVEIKKVYQFNQQNNSKIELSIDGQVSNWSFVENKLFYFDTSTPLFKIDGTEQMNPELLLNSTPKILRWLIRSFFLQDVMDRYYDLHLVYLDLIANLYKEQKAELIDAVLEKSNYLLPKEIGRITRKEVDKYYKEDKFIWQLFLGLRRMDRWVSRNFLGRQYEFILPGKIRR